MATATTTTTTTTTFLGHPLVGLVSLERLKAQLLRLTKELVAQDKGPPLLREGPV